MEAYLVDDLKGMVTNPKKQSLDWKIRGCFSTFEDHRIFPPYLYRSLKIGAVLVGKWKDQQIDFPHLLIPQVPIPISK